MRQCLLISLCLVGLTSYGQNKQLLYGVDDLPQAQLLNPGASYNYDKYIGIPLVSGISVSGGSSGVSVWDIFQEGGDINGRINSAVRSLDNKDVFAANQQLEILSIGWLGRDEKTFYSGGIYQETDFIFYFPKDWAVLAYDGNADYINRSFKFSDISVAAEALSVYHFGVNKKLSRKLRLGARAKIYMSMANVNSTQNEGFFRTRTTPDGPNFYTHEVIGANVTARSSGLAGIIDNDEGLNSITGNAILSPNLGLGLDIGGTYNFTDQLSVSASLLDIGFVSHSQDLKTYRFSGSYALDGIELEFPALLDGEGTTDYWNQFVNEAEAQLPYEDQLAQSYTTWRPVKFNGAINYGFREDLDGGCNCTDKSGRRFTTNVGFHLNAIKRPRSVLTAATIYYDRAWGSFLRTKVTYTANTFSQRNVGLLISTKIKNFNFYLAADNLLEYADVVKARELSLQMGMQLVFDSK
jgi:hypothetical protein